MQKNTLHNQDFLANDLPDGCADLIIADPPYFEVKGDFDYIWSSFEDYLEDVKKWAAECKRLLADNGTLLWYGDDKRIAYAQIIFDQQLTLLNSLVWNKGENFMGLNHSEDLRSFAPCTERLLMYEQRGQKTGGEIVFEQFLKPKNPFSAYLRLEFERAKVNNKEIAKLFLSKTGGLTGCVSNWLNGDNLITKEQYLKIREYLKGEYLRKEYEELRKEYEELRKEYEELRRPFNNIYKLSEVLNFRNEANKNAQYKHPTRKPETLTRALIETTTKKGATIIVPFAGSGTECAVALKESRSFIGYEIDKEHYKTALKRIQHAKEQPLKLF
jgi:DNA modification methylase